MKSNNGLAKRITAALLAIMLCFGDVMLPGYGLILAEEITTPTDLSPIATQEPPETSLNPDAQPSETPDAAPVGTPEATTEAESAQTPGIMQSPVPTATPEGLESEKPTEGLENEPTVAPTTSPEVTEEPENTPAETIAIPPESTDEPVSTKQPEAEPTNGLELPEATEMVSVEPLTILGLTAPDRYAVVGSQSLRVDVAVDGGSAPYSLRFEVYSDGECVHQADLQLDREGVTSLDYMPLRHGDHTVYITLRDAIGMEAVGELTIPVAINVYETEEDWATSVAAVQLTGDWRKDLVAIARTQIGVTESSRNFIIDEQGQLRGYTRYGHWYGASYSEWCAMFVSFCLHYAGVPASAFPQEAGCSTWKARLSDMGVYKDDPAQYVPEKGDLVFFNMEGSKTPEHVGIVTQVNGDSISTIEGNRNRRVQERSYALTDSDIIGYASMRHAMDRAGILAKYEQIDVTVEIRPTTGLESEQIDQTVQLSPAPEEVTGLIAHTNTNAVNLRKEPSVKSGYLGRVKKGTQVTLLAKETPNNELWYLVEYNGKQAYILGSLLDVLVPETTSQPTPAPEASAETDETEKPVPFETPEASVTPAPSEIPEATAEAEASVTPVPSEALEVEKSETPVSPETSAPSEIPEVAVGSTKTPASADGAEEQVVESVMGETITLQVPLMEQTEYQWQRCLKNDGEWENIQDEAIATGWNTNKLTIVVAEESAKYQYRCLIRQMEESSADGLLSMFFGISAAYAEDAGWVALPQVFFIELVDETTPGRIVINGYTQDLHIYNYLYYTNVDNTELLSGGGAELGIAGDANGGTDILIGDQDNGAEDGNKAPIPGQDIVLTLAGAQNDVTVYEVNGGINCTKMTVAAQADMASLTIKGRLELTLDNDLTIDAVVLESGAAIVVDTNGHTLTIGTLTGGSVTLSGNGSIVVKEALKPESLTIKGITLDGSGVASVTAAKISVSDATISSAALFGADSSIQGDCLLTFTGSNTLSDIATVGAGNDCSAMVRIDGLSHIGSHTNISVVYDYSIIYTENITNPAAATEIAPQTGWLVSYRAKSNGLNNAMNVILGGRTYTGTEVGAYTAVDMGTLDLPEYSREGYVFGNWLTDGATAAIDKLTVVAGDLTLRAALEPYAVVVTLDLGYDPSRLTNDTVPERKRVVQTVFGQQVELEKPTRFGYLFQGWVVRGRMEESFEAQYTINHMEHLVASEEGEAAYSLTLEAQWIEDVFPIYLSIPENDGSLDSTGLYITMAERPSDADWVLLSEFLADHAELFERSTHSFTIANNENGIKFGETLDEWFARLGQIVGETGWRLPVLRLVQDNSTKDFTAWQVGGVPMTGDHAMTNAGEFGFLHAGSMTLTDYQASLHTAQPMAMTAQFVEGFTLTVNGLNSSWEVWLEEKGSTVATKQLVPDALGKIDQVMIPLGTKLHWRIKKSSAELVRGITPWAFACATGFDFDIVEMAYDPSKDTYIDYVFTMPNCNVTATLDDGTVWLDLANSPITFERRHTYNNRTLDGFWYSEKLTELTPIYKNDAGAYFYTWDYADKFYVTSNNVATQNQLTLVDAITVVLKECTLQPTDAYLSDAVGRTLAGSSAEGGLAKSNTAKYGNIVISTTAIQQYAVNLIVQGINTVGTIFQNNIKTEMGYTTTLKISGENSGVLNLGGLWGTYAATFSGLTINSIETNSEYLCSVTTGGESRGVGLTFSGCVVNAPEKRLSSRYSTVTFSGATKADVGSTYGYSGVVIGGKSSVRIRGDASSSHRTVSLDVNSSLLVEGNLTYVWNHGTASTSVKGVLVVKGSRCDLGNLSMSGSGALIVSNMITLGKTCSIGGGTIVTNQIMNTPYSVSRVILANSNGDSAFLATYAQDYEAATTYNFTGGSVYLLGQKYDASVKASDDSNPVSNIINTLLDENGALVNTAVTHNTAYGAVQAAASTSNECFVLGNSAWTSTTSRSRSVRFAGSKIYAAGNITLFNDTTVSAGIIECSGVLSSKHTLDVTGGSITAEGVGNAYNITTMNNGLYRYAKTNITGGTLTVNGLGAVAVPIADVEACSVVTIGTGASIIPRTGDTVHVRNVLYTNYVGSTDAFDFPAVPEVNPRSLIFETDISQGTTSLSRLLNMSEDAAFAAPQLAGTEISAAWAYDSVIGTTTAFVSAAGYVNGTEQDGYVYDGCDYIALYAVKDNYPLVVNGTYKGGFTVSAEQNDSILTTNGTLDVSVKKMVTITLEDAAHYQRTLVWYKDAAGVPVNVLTMDGSVLDAENHTISFPMPSFEVEVWITEELTLDLYYYPILFTADGFRVEWGETRANSDFAYAGNLRVEQSNINTMAVKCWDANASVDNVIHANGSGTAYATTNYFRFEDGADLLDRRVTLHQIQQIGGSDNEGNQVADGVDAKLVVSGIVQLVHINVPENASVDISGEAGENDTTDVFYIYQPSRSSSSCYAIGTLQGKAGDIALRNMRVLAARYSTMGYSNTANPNATFLMENCTFVNSVEYAYATLVQRMGTMRIVNSTIEITTDNGHSDANISGVTTVEVVNSAIKHKFGSATGAAHSFFNGAAYVAMNNSSMELTWKSSTTSSQYLYETLYSDEPEVTLNNNSTITSNYRQLFKKLTVNSGSSVRVRGDESETILLCPALTVNDGLVEADNIVISGFFTGDVKDETAVDAALEAGTNVVTSGRLDINGGMVTAAGFVGGDANAVINVTDGTLCVKEIGTSGLLYGFAQYIPKASEPYFYTIDIYDCKDSLDLGAEINISGGTVNITQSGCLGGVNTQINVGGGLVQLAPESVLGMNAEHESEYLLHRAEANPAHVMIDGGMVEHAEDCIMGGDAASSNGSIRTPYGAVTISGESTGVHVHDLTAEHGSITISDTGNTYYGNPYEGDDVNAGDDKINVRVDNLLQAGQKLSISNAVVYADSAYVNPEAGVTATLSITPSGSIQVPALYVGNNYGKAPQSSGVSNIDVVSYRYVHGSEQKSIVYVLNEDMCGYADSYTIENDNINSYIYSPNDPETITLNAPVWKGRVFLGWYTDADFDANSTIHELHTDTASGYVLYAKWAYETVRFSVTVPATLNELSNAAVFVRERNGIAGYWNETAGTFTFQKTVEVPYGSSVVSGLNLDNNYQLTSLRVSSVKYNESIYADQTVDAVNTGIYELYLSKIENNTVTQLGDSESAVTIELTATGTVKKRLYLTLDLNLNNGYPVDAAFPVGGVEPETKTATTWISVVETGQSISSAKGFVVDEALVEPTAVGYDFMGWFTTPDWKGEGTAVQASAVPTDHTTYYARWKPKTYLVSFDAGENSRLTESGARPTEQTAEQILYALVEYDAPLSSMVYAAANDNAWTAEDAEAGLLPAAWKIGQAFGGWYAADADEKKLLAETDYFNMTALPYISVENNATQIADGTWTAAEFGVQFAPVYEMATFHFHANGGYLKDGDNLLSTLTQQKTEHQPFPGYTDITDQPMDDGSVDAVHTQKCDCGEESFAILSTTPDAFEESKVHDAKDYRHAVQRVGYTFCGWYESSQAAAEAVATGDFSAAMGTVAQYPEKAEMDLYAAWSPNTYTVNLQAPADKNMHSGYSTSTAVQATVTVGQSVEDTNWPERGNSGWYAYNNTEADQTSDNLRRYLLGFTFDQVDPGDSRQGENGYDVYLHYAKTITEVINAGCIFTGAENTTAGTVFKIPMREYAISTVPDYPDESKFDLYAVYRERSLVFIEKYELDGMSYQKVLSSGPVDTYDNYPARYQNDTDNGNYSMLRDADYTLKYWAVNGSESTTFPSTETAYQERLQQYKTTAQDMGAYDVNVYTVYTANVEIERQLVASTMPTENRAYANAEMPGSIHEDAMRYTLELPDGFCLTDGMKMAGNRFNPSWTTDSGETREANNTVAIWMELKDTSGTVRYEGWMQESAMPIPMGDVSISKGWKIELTMYHSSVISDSKEYTIPMKFSFATEEDQSVKLNVKVVLKPVQYQLNYQTILPDNPLPDVPLVIEASDFELASNGLSYITSQTGVEYGSTLMGVSNVPSVEGYSWSGVWSYHDLIWDEDTFTMPIKQSDNGIISLTTGYVRNEYQLLSDEATRKQMTIFHGEGSEITADEEQVLYRSIVRMYGDPDKLYITKGTESKILAEWIQEDFVTENADGSYSFVMPAETVRITAYTLLEGAGTLTACETTHAHASGETDTYTFSFADGNAGAILAGKQIFLRDVIANGFTLDSKANVNALAASAGSDYVNSTFAFTMAFANGTGMDVHSAADGMKDALGTIGTDSQLVIRLHNANALTIPGECGSLQLVFATDNTDSDAADELLITLTVTRVASQLNVTVPLVIVMQTNIDGGSVAVSEETYAIDNDSSMRIQLTGMTIADTSDVMTIASDTTDLSAERDTFRVQRNADWENHNLYANGETGEKYNPIDSIATSPLSFVTKPESGWGEHMATITYTVSIPEENESPDDNSE